MLQRTAGTGAECAACLLCLGTQVQLRARHRDAGAHGVGVATWEVGVATPQAGCATVKKSEPGFGQ